MLDYFRNEVAGNTKPHGSWLAAATDEILSNATVIRSTDTLLLVE